MKFLKILLRFIVVLFAPVWFLFYILFVIVLFVISFIIYGDPEKLIDLFEDKIIDIFF